MSDLQQVATVARYPLGSVVGVELLASQCSAWRRAAVAPSQVVAARGLFPIL